MLAPRLRPIIYLNRVRGCGFQAHLALIGYVNKVDPLNFPPRVHTPVLMLNGRYDFTFPLQACQLPLFRLLGTPGTDTEHVLCDTAHTVPRTPEMIREVLDWLDRYLGSVD
jgi:dipeptidyl aminopeptidase/acylaminoacyl peptidase